MRFPDTYENGSGDIHELLQPALQVDEGRDVLEAAIGEAGAVVSLGRSDPVEGAAQAVVVVVLDEAGQGHLGFVEAGEALAINDLLLQHSPEGFDLAVCPGRADLSSQVLDVEVTQALAEEGDYARHPDHEWHAVVAHQLHRATAEFEALVEPGQDGIGFGCRQDPEPDHEAGVVAAAIPNSEATRTARIRRRISRRSGLGGSFGGRPFWVARKRKPGPSWYR